MTLRSHQHYCFRIVIYQQSTFYTISPPKKHNFFIQRQLLRPKSILFYLSECSGKKKVSSTASAIAFGAKKLTFLPQRTLGKEKSMLFCSKSSRRTKKVYFLVSKVFAGQKSILFRTQFQRISIKNKNLSKHYINVFFIPSAIHLQK